MSDLAREVAATPAAISWLLSSRATGKLSSLIPAVEEKIGWTVSQHEADMVNAAVDEATRGYSPEGKKHVREIVDVMFGDRLQMELLGIFRDLERDDQMRLLERARVLHEESEARKNRVGSNT